LDKAKPALEAINKWVEILGAGILRPEVVIPLYGKFIPVLAWGLGLDRLIKEKFHIKDIREIYTNDLGFLRKREVLK
ncbi:MAG: phenylalanine--tRNA ligase subunit alpha, partial [Nanoarchaeota archaeon]